MPYPFGSAPLPSTLLGGIPFALLSLLTAGCAVKFQPPAPPAPRSATAASASAGRTWDAVIDVFAERHIPIRNMERVSGFISTEQLGIDDPEAIKWADCGSYPATNRTPEERKFRDPVSGKNRMALQPNRAAYNVLVRGDSAQSTVKVTVRWHVGSRGGARHKSASGRDDIPDWRCRTA